MSLVWQSVFPEDHMISDISPENGFPRQCAHWLGMTLCLRLVYNSQGGSLWLPPSLSISMILSF